MGLQATPDDPAAVEARAAAAAFYDEMEKGLGSGEWLAGSYSYADIAFYMAQLFGERMGAPMTDAIRGCSLARPHERAAGGAPGGGRDGALSAVARAHAAGFLARLSG